MGWDEKLGGWLVRVLLQSNGEGGYEAVPRDLVGVASGYGLTEREAMVMVRANLTEKIKKLNKTPVIPWVEVSCYRRIGAEVKWVLIKKSETDL